MEYMSVPTVVLNKNLSRMHGYFNNPSRQALFQVSPLEHMFAFLIYLPNIFD